MQQSSFLLLLLPVVLVLFDGLLITLLSTTSVTSLISGVLADDITTDKGIPFLSVKIMSFCAYFDSISRINSSHRPPKGDFMDILSMDCQVKLIPIRSS